MSDKNSQFKPDKYKFTEKETRVVLEDIKSDFKVFGEDLQSIRRVQGEHTGKIDNLEEKVGELTVDMQMVKSDVKILKTDVSTLKTDVSTLKTDVSTLKTDVSTLKTDMKWVKEQLNDIKSQLEQDHITRSEFEEIKQKVASLEMLVKNAT